MLRFKLLIINECDGVTANTGAKVGLVVKTRLAPSRMLFGIMALKIHHGRTIVPKFV